jgi:16S rRNA (guanine966-N2)-methyltransferase
LHFPRASDLRPTPDRVRETLFNWLQFEIAGTRCLDLFAGSGALGFEALSRRAREVVFVESEPVVATAIRATLERLHCDRGTVVARDAFEFLAARASVAFDVVFLDPPYAARWLEPACERLERNGWLAAAAWVYLEDAAGYGAPALPAGWTLLRSKRAGDVGYHLARRGTPTLPATAESPEQGGA